MSVLKALARDWLPPVLVRWFRQMRGGGIRFEGDFATWDEANSHCTGYDAEYILAKVLASALKVKHGEAAAERDSVLFDQIEYAWPVLAGLMWAAARTGGRLNVLDFGGALGSSYFQNRKFLQPLPDVRWNVVEQPHYIDAGRKHIQDTPLQFYKTIEECLSESQPNVVFLSSVLQYLPDPFGMLNKLGAVNADVLILDRTSFSISGDYDTIRLQHVPENIYKATYPCHVFNEGKLCQYISDMGYDLIEAYGSLDNFDPDTCWRGHIFLRRANGR
jgi:putative methyltransferase (TIGR04325 family)